MGSKYLIAREDIENLFNHPDKFEPVRNERKAITTKMPESRRRLLSTDSGTLTLHC